MRGLSSPLATRTHAPLLLLLLLVCLVLPFQKDMQVQAQPGGIPGGDNIPDDLYHCQDPREVDKKDSIKCDKDSYKWQVDDLDPEEPPEVCGGEDYISNQPGTMPVDWPDWYEPCLLWSVMYGSLSSTAPTEIPSFRPSFAPVEPTDPPTNEDGEEAPVDVGIPTEPPTLNPTPLPEPTASPTDPDPTVLPIEAFTMTLFVPEDAAPTLDKMELFEITQSHIRVSLEAELVHHAIDSITLEMETVLASAQATEDAANSSKNVRVTELVSGQVKFEQPAPIPSDTLQKMIQDAFEDNGLKLFELQLQLAKDQGLQQVEKVAVGNDNGGNGNGNQDDDSADGFGLPSNNENDDSSVLLIIIVVCVLLGIVMACIFAYCLLYGRKGIRQKQRKQQMMEKNRELPGIVTDPTPTEDDTPDYSSPPSSSQDQHHYYNDEQQQNHRGRPRNVPHEYPRDIEGSSIPEPYLLNAVDSSDAGSSLPVDSDTITTDEGYDEDGQSMAPSLYSYREDPTVAPSIAPSIVSPHQHSQPSWYDQRNQQHRQQAAPPRITGPPASGVKRTTNTQKNNNNNSKSTTAKGAKSSSSGGGGGFMSGLMGKYYSSSPKKSAKNNNNNNADEESQEDEYGFDKEANPRELAAGLSMDDGSSILNNKVDDASSSYQYDDNRSLVSDGRVGQILGDVRSIQGQEPQHNFDEIWNDEEDSDDDGNVSVKQDHHHHHLHSGNRTNDEDISHVLSTSRGTPNRSPTRLGTASSMAGSGVASTPPPPPPPQQQQPGLPITPVPFDERVSSTESRPFDERRIEQRDIVIPPAADGGGASPSGGGATMAGVTEDDEVSQIVMDDDDESVEDYHHHHDDGPSSLVGGANYINDNDDSTQGSYPEEASIAEDSYGFVYQRHYHGKKNKPSSQAAAAATTTASSIPSTNKKNKSKDDNSGSVNLTLPASLLKPGNVVLEPGDDDESVEAISVESEPRASASAAPPQQQPKSLGRRIVKGMSVRKKKASDWGGGAESNKTSSSSSQNSSRSRNRSKPVTISPDQQQQQHRSRPTSPSPSEGSSDSAKFRALMSEPDVYDSMPPKGAGSNNKLLNDKNYLVKPASLLQRMPSDSDEDDCYIDDDQPVVPYPASLLQPEEKKEDSSVVFSLDA
eukprot:scaffold25364_cov132-Cylindrotheca_fusiformis.AAC.1